MAAVRSRHWGERAVRSAATVNPYGAGGASARILAIVRGASGGSRAKHFVDLPRDSVAGSEPPDPEKEQ